MQALRDHSCHCFSCFAATTRAIARRPITSPTHGRLRYKHLTTLFYSTVITSAAVLDVNVKGKRRRQWDSAIAEAERSLHTASSQVALKPAARVIDHVDEDDIAFPVDNVPSILEEMEQSVINVLDQAIDRGQLKVLSAQVLSSLEPGRTVPVFVPESRGGGGGGNPYSIYASEFRKSRERGGIYTPWSPKKQITVELSMAKLATRFLLWTKSNWLYKPELECINHTSVTKLKRSLREISLKLEDIKTKDAHDLGDIQRLEYPQYAEDRRAFAGQTADLNRALLVLLGKHALNRLTLQDMMAKITHNLLISPAPPDVQTLSILISRFSRLRYFDLADMVCNAMEETYMRVNELVLSDALAHFVRKRDANGFQRMVRLMHGQQGGLNLARSDIKIGVGASRLVRKSPDKIIQLVELDQNLYNVLISGSLTFDNISQATVMYKLMRKSGYRADLQLLTSFLQYFRDRADWQRGLALWHNIQYLHLKRRPLLDSDEKAERVAFRTILDLCRVCESTQTSKAIYDEALERGHTPESLGQQGPVIRSFDWVSDQLESFKRKSRILERRSFLILDDVKQWAMQVLAARILLSGAPLQSIRVAFLRHSDEFEFEKWSSSRQSTLQRHTLTGPAEIDQPGLFANDGLSTQNNTEQAVRSDEVSHPTLENAEANYVDDEPHVTHQPKLLETGRNVDQNRYDRSLRTFDNAWSHHRHNDDVQHAMM